MICFVANYSKTDFFDRLSDVLVEAGVDVFWITVNQDISNRLERKYGKNKVLRIGLDSCQNTPIGDYRLNELIYGDRLLSFEPNAFGYLTNIQAPIYEFIKNNGINTIFGELTWAHEILVHRIVSNKPELGCKYLNPHTVRIPYSHFGFFVDEFQTKLFENKKYRVVNSINIEVKKPDYLASNDVRINTHFSLSGRLGRLINFISPKAHDKYDPTMFQSKFRHFYSRIQLEINRELYRFVRKYKALDFVNSDYVCLFLHKQPEASVDVTGRYYENQVNNIINIWRGLPDNWILLVKEHSNAIGDRGAGFFNKIKKLNRVYVIDEGEDSYNLIQHAKCVVSVSGTVCYEAALSGIQSLSFSPMFFNELIYSNQISLDDIREKNISEILSEEKHGLNNEDYSRWLALRCYPGEIGDSVFNPRAMSDNNVRLVAHAFLCVI